MPRGTQLSKMTAIAAHRGGADLWPENSLSAFRNAVQLPIEFVEFDVHRTRDGILVVHHDATLDRTTTGSGPIGLASWAELSELRLKHAPDEGVPTLEAVLDIFAGSSMRPRLEIKTGPGGQRYEGIEAEVVDMLRAKSLLERTVVTSFVPECLISALGAGAPAVLHLLGGEALAALRTDLVDFARRQRKIGITEIAVRAEHLTADLVASCHEADLAIGAYAVRDQMLPGVFKLGLRAFTTNRPDLAIAARRGEQAS